MTIARLESQIRVYDFVKLTILFILVIVLGLMSYSAAVGLQPSLSSGIIEAVAGEPFLIEGGGDPGRQIIVQAGDQELGRAIVNDQGTWAIEVTAPERPSKYNVLLQNESSPQNVIVYGALRVLDPSQAQATEEAATMFSAESEVDKAVATIVAEVDVPPFEVSQNLREDARLLAGGSAEINGFAAPNATIEVVIDGEIVQTISADEDGRWETTLQIDEVGAHSLGFVVTDTNGVVTTTEVINFERYQEPTIEYAPSADNIPNELIFSGTAEQGARIGIEVNDQIVAITRADNYGEWLWVGKLPIDARSEILVRAVMLDEANAALVEGSLMEVVLVEGDQVMAEEVVASEDSAETEPVIEEVVEPSEEIEVPAPPAEGLAALTMPDALLEEGRFNTLYAALELTGNIYTLKLDEKFSIFAPTDAAFNKLPERVLIGYQNNIEALRGLLLHHLVQGNLYTDDLPVRGQVKTAANTELILSNVGGIVEVEDILLDKSDITLSNGVLHEINTVLIPPSDFEATRIDTSGVSNFKGNELTVVGTGEPGAQIILEMNGAAFGTGQVDQSGYWTVPGFISPGEYEIIAYALDENDVLQNLSDTVTMTVTE